MIRLENTTPPHNKFWEARVVSMITGWDLIRGWGRIGTVGVEQRNNYSSRVSAENVLKRIVEVKLDAHGYLVVSCDTEIERIFSGNFIQTHRVAEEVSINSNDNVEEEALPEENYVPTEVQIRAERRELITNDPFWFARPETNQYAEARRRLVERHERENWRPSSEEVIREVESNPGTYGAMPNPASSIEARRILIERHRDVYEPTREEIEAEVVRLPASSIDNRSTLQQYEEARRRLLGRHQVLAYAPTNEQVREEASEYCHNNPLSMEQQLEEARTRLILRHRDEEGSSEQEVQPPRTHIDETADTVRRALENIPIEGGESIITMLKDDKDREKKISIQQNYHRKMTKRPSLQELLT